VTFIANHNSLIYKLLAGGKTCRFRWLNRHNLNETIDSPFEIIDLIQGDGDGQFRVLSDQLNRLPNRPLGLLTAPDVRKHICKRLKREPAIAGVIPSTNDNEFCTMGFYGNWYMYLDEIKTPGRAGDEVTLRAAANVFSVRIIIVSSLGPPATRVYSPTSPVAPVVAAAEPATGSVAVASDAAFLPTLYIGHDVMHGGTYVGLKASNDFSVEDLVVASASRCNISVFLEIDI